MLNTRYTMNLWLLFLLITGPTCYAGFPFIQSSTSSLAPMLEKTKPAVVSVTVEGTHVSKQPIPEMYRYFFGPDAPKEQIQKRTFTGLGSGVIINADEGHIITNYHVIASASKIIVGLDDGREVHALLLGFDEHADIAILKINENDLTEIPQANSDKLKVGDFVVAIGNPFGLGQTVTSGIVSALGRSGLGIERLENFIQTDAAINRGNSGGALVNLKGELVGINTAITTNSGGNLGIGFAIPVNMANNLFKQIVKYGHAKRGQLGIIGENLNMKLAQALDVKSTHGVFIKQVLKESPAEKAGIHAGDIIISVNQKLIKSIENLRATVTTLGPGYQVTVQVLRKGGYKNFTVTLSSPMDQSFKQKKAEMHRLHPGLNGATLVETQSGIMIAKVASGSNASYNGFIAGDVILEINNKRVQKLNELKSYSNRTRGAIALNISRKDSMLYIVLR